MILVFVMVIENAFRAFISFQISPKGDLLSFTRVKESKQRKHAPVKSLIFALFQFSSR